MIDDHTSPPPLKGSLSEELLKRPKPDAWTVAWFKSQIDEILRAYRGACHAINLAVANTRDNAAELKRHSEQMEAIQKENQLLQARMGELQAENVLIQKRIDDMAAWAKTKGKKE